MTSYSICEASKYINIDPKKLRDFLRKNKTIIKYKGKQTRINYPQLQKLFYLFLSLEVCSEYYKALRVNK